MTDQPSIQERQDVSGGGSDAQAPRASTLGLVTPPDTDSGWYATPAYWATFFKHRMKDWRIAACGERHYEWWPVERFADPSVFAECPECAAMGEA